MKRSKAKRSSPPPGSIPVANGINGVHDESGSELPHGSSPELSPGSLPPLPSANGMNGMHDEHRPPEIVSHLRPEANSPDSHPNGHSRSNGHASVPSLRDSRGGGRGGRGSPYGRRPVRVGFGTVPGPASDTMAGSRPNGIILHPGH